MARRVLKSAQRLIDSEFFALVRRELAKHTDPDEVARALRALKAGHAFSGVKNSQVDRLIDLMSTLSRSVDEAATSRRTKALAHLFADAPPDAAHAAYLRRISELLDLVDSPAFRRLVTNNPDLLEKHAHQLSRELADVVDSYDALKKETGLLNAIVKALYPKDYPSLRTDAHHVIEDRAYEKFKDAWKLIGWDSPNDMAAIGVLYEFHIRSPKRLPGIAELGKQEDMLSLTQELLHAIDLSKIDTPEQLIAEYRKYYYTTELWKKTAPVLDRVERQLSLAKSRQKLFQELKKLK